MSARMPARFIRFLVVVSTFALVAVPARGESKHDKGQKQVEQARRAYNLGHWSDALAAFEKAYETSGDSALLFNLAESHRQLGHTGDALRLYNEYLREMPNGSDREAAATEIKNLGGTSPAKSAAAAPPPPKPTTPPPATTPPPVAAAPAKPAPPPPAPPPPVVAAPAKPAPPPPAPPRPAASNPPPPMTATPPPPMAATPPPPPPAGPAPVAPIGPASSGTMPPPPAAPPAAESPLLVTQAPPPAHHSKVPVIIGAAATGAFVAGAVAFTLSSNSLYNDLKTSCGVTAMGCTQSQVDGVKTRDHAATAFWIAAGVAAVATSVLLVVRF
jgi:hypothetical protein